MPFRFSQPDRLRVSELHNLAIDPDPDEPFPFHLLDYVAKFAFLVLQKRREQNDPGLGRKPENLIDDLLGRLPMDWLARRWIVGLSDSRKEDPEIVENLSGGRDGGTGIGSRASLLNRNRRGAPFDEIDVRFLHLIQELPGVGGEALDVAALALGIKGIEGKRGLSGAAEAGNDDQLFPRNLHLEILEIVLARTADLDSLRRHRTPNVEPVSQAQLLLFSSECP